MQFICNSLYSLLSDQIVAQFYVGESRKTLPEKFSYKLFFPASWEDRHIFKRIDISITAWCLSAMYTLKHYIDRTAVVRKPHCRFQKWEGSSKKTRLSISSFFISSYGLYFIILRKRVSFNYDLQPNRQLCPLPKIKVSDEKQQLYTTLNWCTS